MKQHNDTRIASLTRRRDALMDAIEAARYSGSNYFHSNETAEIASEELEQTQRKLDRLLFV